MKDSAPSGGTVFEEAIRFALRAHRGMTRKGSRVPYIVHPLEVASIAATMTEDEEVLAAAVLHDVAEDTPYTVDDIRAQFGNRVAALVASETEDKMRTLPPEQTWLARKTALLAALPAMTREEKILTLSDKLSNLRSCRKEQLLIGDRLWEKFHEKRKERHAWYYREILRATRELKDEFAYLEYGRLVEEVFREDNSETTAEAASGSE